MGWSGWGEEWICVDVYGYVYVYMMVMVMVVVMIPLTPLLGGREQTLDVPLPSMCWIKVSRFLRHEVVRESGMETDITQPETGRMDKGHGRAGPRDKKRQGGRP